jgi:hypothetical protein
LTFVACALNCRCGISPRCPGGPRCSL